MRACAPFACTEIVRCGKSMYRKAIEMLEVRVDKWGCGIQKTLLADTFRTGNIKE